MYKSHEIDIICPIRIIVSNGMRNGYMIIIAFILRLHILIEFLIQNILFFFL